MADATDIDLLRDYVRQNSEAAFAELVRRHINLVYSVALRFTGHPGDAQDITQAVFIILARKAARLRETVVLAGWLYETTRFTAARQLRTQARRLAREQEAYMQSDLNAPDTHGVWLQLAPHLETAMARLSEADRTVLALRYYENLTGAEAALQLGIREEAAHKRTARALEKLRNIFAKRGLRSITATLAAAISTHSIHAAPAALAKIVTATALAKGAVASVSTLTLVKGALKVMAWTNAKTAITGAVVVGLTAYSVFQYQAQVKLRDQNESLQLQMQRMKAESEWLALKQREFTPHLPAPQFQFAAAPTNASTSESNESTNLFSRLYDRLKDKQVKLTREQADAFLGANGRTASTLLAAFRTSGDRALLKEAMEKFPNDPQVAFEAVGYNLAHLKDASPEDQRKWLDAFEKAAPDNALANYLSAINHFNAGQIDEGVRDMAGASGKSLDDYTVSRGENDMEAYLAAGYPVADAEVLATSQLLLPQLAQLKQLALNTADLANAYRQAGDPASAQAVLQFADNLGRQYATPSPGEPTVSQLVGIAIEKIALNAMDPNSPYGEGGGTVQDRLNQLTQQRSAVNQTSEQVSNLLPSLTDQDWIIYKNRWMMFGEQNAQQWVIGKYGHQ